MKTTEIQFDGRTYRCRIVESIDREELIIYEDENEGFAGDEAERLYDEIFYFTDERTLRLPDNELVAELKESNPDWFE